MTKIHRLVILSLFSAALGLAGTAAAQSPAASGPVKEEYQDAPFLATGTLIPEVLLVVSKEYKMFSQAYAGLIIDFDDDGRMDTGFNPNAKYIGYFDPFSCYKYQGGKGSGSSYVQADSSGYFLRVGSTIPDEGGETITGVSAPPDKPDPIPSRPTGLKGYIPAPRSITGVCQRKSAGGGNYSGNWLNFITSSRMDVIRKILYGGSRSTDSAAETYLESSFVPPDATVWGAEILADNIWHNTPYNAYYDITKYTPFPKPENGQAHFFARVRDMARFERFPALRAALNVSFAPTGGKTGHYGDWVFVDRPVPNDGKLPSGTKRELQSYRVRVKVCDPKNIEAESYGCKKYGDNYKPAGLLQKYGGRIKKGDKEAIETLEPERMYFGLLTGGFSEDLRMKGGILRRHIDSLSKSINPDTGQFLTNGLPWAMDKLHPSGRYNDDKGDGGVTNDYSSVVYLDNNAWGNPIGEMLLEGVRYLAGKPDPIYHATEDLDLSSGMSVASPLNDLKANNSLASWAGRPKDLKGGACAKPVILLISDIDSSYDGDDIVNDLDAEAVHSNPALPTKAEGFNMDKYLEAITKHEGLVGGTYLFTKNSSSDPRNPTNTDDCSPKKIDKSLREVSGICPQSPSYEGTYSAAAAAHYAHTHNFSRGANKAPIDIYAVTMSAAFPELTFPLKEGGTKNGKVVKSISVLPVNTTPMTNRSTIKGRCNKCVNTGKVLNFLNYLVVDWQVAKNGDPFSITIRVNYSASSIADDFEMDATQDYTVSLLTTKALTPAAALGDAIPTNNTALVSGAFRGKPADTYYQFKNPATAQSYDDFITIKPEQVVGLAVRTTAVFQSAGDAMGMGYTISGTQYDGTYIETAKADSNSVTASKYNTPVTCPYTNGPTGAPNNCRSTTLPTDQIRTFEFASGTGLKYLPNPLWLTAKYGGFDDRNNNGLPDDESNEWAGPDGNPKNYFQATNISELADKLDQAFKDIAKAISTGTATSAAVNSVLGGGVSIQTLYYPEYDDPTGRVDNERDKVKWLGAVYGLFVDKWGNLREDTNQNGRLDLKTGEDGKNGDRVVVFTQDGDDQPVIARYDDVQGDGGRGNSPLKLYDKPDSVQKLKAVWDTSRKLAEGEPANRNILYQAGSVVGGKFLHLDKLNEFKPLSGGSADLAYLTKMMIQDNTKDLLPGFGGGETLANALIRYIKGERVPGWRPREVGNPWTGATCDRSKLAGEKAIGDLPKGDGCVTWRLGDIINSKPIIVGSPASNYDWLYNDASYAEYKTTKAALRRHVAYFGANDGLLHAVNLGFFGSLTDGQVGYCGGRDAKGKLVCAEKADEDLGKERWAFLPTALLPHLQWLADPGYQHAYYVDMKPLIADLQIKGEWKTVLIGGLRLGGREIPAGGEASYAELFALDVTDPEKNPEFLWRYSAKELGLSVGLPLAVNKSGHWYVVLASGPAMPLGDKYPNKYPKPYEGYSDQQARLIIIDAETGAPALDPAAKDYKLAVPEKEGLGFFNDGFLTLAAKQGGGGQGRWGHELAYYGLTVSPTGGEGAACRDTGAVYRLVMDGAPSNWQLKRFVNVERPVTGAVNATRDDRGRQWVLFGTGRLWGQRDQRPPCGVDKGCLENHTQYLYGLMEPVGDDGKTLSYADLTASSTIDQLASAGKIIDVSGGKVYKVDPEGGRVEGLNAVKGLEPSVCAPENGGIGYECLAGAIAGQLGYRRALDTQGVLGTSGRNYEMILTQPKIDGLGNGRSYMAFTSFKPPTPESLCTDDSESYLHMVDTFTGLPAPYMYRVFSHLEEFDKTPVAGDAKQVAGYRKAGGGKATEAVILHTDTGTKVQTSGQNSSIYELDLTSSETLPQGVISWREVMDMGFSLTPREMTLDMP